MILFLETSTVRPIWSFVFPGKDKSRESKILELESHLVHLSGAAGSGYCGRIFHLIGKQNFAFFGKFYFNLVLAWGT